MGACRDGGDCHRGSIDRAALGIDGRIPRNFRMGIVRIYAGAGTGGGPQLGRRDPYGSDDLDRGRPPGNAVARDRRLFQGIHVPIGSNSIRSRTGAVVSHLLRGVVDNTADCRSVYRPRRSRDHGDVSVRLEDLEVGQSAEITKTISSEDVARFAEITGDFNPVHLDEAVAEKSFFGGRVAHGMLTAGLISAALAGKLPGPGTVYLSQTLRFTAPVRIGDTVTTRVEVTELIPAKRRVKLSTVCRNQKNEVVVNGEAMVLLPESAEYDVFEITGAQVK